MGHNPITKNYFEEVSEVYINEKKKCLIYKDGRTFNIVKFSSTENKLPRMIKSGMAHYRCQDQKKEPQSPLQCEKWLRSVSSLKERQGHLHLY